MTEKQDFKTDRRLSLKDVDGVTSNFFSGCIGLDLFPVPDLKSFLMSAICAAAFRVSMWIAGKSIETEGELKTGLKKVIRKCR